MVKYEEKFIVINKKHIKEYEKCWRKKYASSSLYSEVPQVKNLLSAIEMFTKAYETYTEKPLNQKYYVVNQDEPYADSVIKFILDNEEKK